MLGTLVACAPAGLEGEGYVSHFRVAVRGRSRGHTAGQRLRHGGQGRGGGSPATSRGLVGLRPRAAPAGIAVAAAAVKTGVVRGTSRTYHHPSSSSASRKLGIWP